MTFPRPFRSIVTGAGSGLGRALALELAGRGSSVVAADIDLGSAEHTVELVRAAGGTARAARCDVSEREAVFELVDGTERDLGGVDLLANNAGVSVGGSFDQIEIEDWQWLVDINLWGVIYGCQAAIPKMKARGRGYILNVASAAGLLVPPATSAYSVSKAAVVALSEALYTEYKSAGIRVTALCPGYFRTNLLEATRGARTPEQDQMVGRWMEGSKLQGPEVAKAAIDAVRDGKLYAQPMRYTRMAWRLKRTAPQRFYDVLDLVYRRTLDSKRR